MDIKRGRIQHFLEKLLAQVGDIRRDEFPDEESYVQASIIVGVLLTFLLSWLPHIFIYWFWLDLPFAAVMVAGIGVPSAVLSMLMVKYWQRYKEAAILGHFGGLVTLILVSIDIGGSFSVVPNWLVLGTITLFLCVGQAASLMITVFCAVMMLVLGSLHYRGMVPGPNINNRDFVLFSSVSLFGVYLTTGVVTSLFHRRVRRSFLKAEKARQSEEEKNRDMKAILRNISVGILSITRQGKIHPDYSQSLELILERSQLSGLDALEVLYSQSQIPEDQRQQARSAIEASLGESFFNFDMNAHCLPRQILWQGSQGQKYLELDWDPVIDSSELIDKILVSVKDATDHIVLQAKNAEAEETMSFIKELIEVDHERYLVNHRSSLALLAESEKLLHLHARYEPEVLKILFINMHTIKGDARTLGLKKISECAHTIEHYYVDMMKEGEAATWNQQERLKDLSNLRSLYEKFLSIACEKLGREEQSHTIRLNKQDIATKVQQIDWKEMESLPVVTRNSIRDVMIEINRNLYFPLEAFREEIIKSIRRLAKDLSKVEPRLVFDSRGLFVSDKAVDILRKCLVHLMRNALDHGLEFPDEREALGKTPYGTLTVTTFLTEKYLCLKVQDDGRGLNLKKLRAMGLQKGLIAQDASDLVVAELIYADGISTAGAVGDVSGRGMGMSAMRKFLRDFGGDIRIQLHGLESANGFASASFELSIPKEQSFHIAILAA